MAQRVDLKVGFSCNNNCIHCVISDKFAERDLTLQEIEDILLQLPLLLYDVTDDYEVVGMQSDLAGLIYKEAYNEALKIARGTVQEKTSASELATMTEKFDTVIYDRAYKIIKQKISMAVEVLNAVKRIQATRVQGAELGNKINF